ncbi:MAG: hypothetical protein NDF54_10830 [archaeon GB-1867-035]|nr:hypothetical protein [Candidatus Culexmicrobium profundum]
MTHSLHRLGDYENLRNDYVVLVMSAKGFNDKGSAVKLKRALELSFKYNPVNYGDIKTGNKFSASRDSILENYYGHFNYSYCI